MTYTTYVTYDEAHSVLSELLDAGIDDSELGAALQKALLAVDILAKAGGDGGMCTGRGHGGGIEVRRDPK